MAEFANKKSRGRMHGISATRLSRGDPWAFRPTLADGLVLSLPAVNGVDYETKKTVPLKTSNRMIRIFRRPGCLGEIRGLSAPSSRMV